MTIYYEDTQTQEFLTEEEYEKLANKVSRLKKISISEREATEHLLKKLDSENLEDYSKFYCSEEELDQRAKYEKSKEANTVVVISFKEETNTTQIFEKLKNNSLKPEVSVQQVMLIQRVYDEKNFTVLDFENLSGESKEWRDSILGIIVGFFGGPLGAILGWAVGDVVGFEQSFHEERKAKTLFHYVANDILRGQEGVLAVVKEKDDSLLDDLVKTKLGGEIHRFSFKQLKEDIKTLKKYV